MSQVVIAEAEIPRQKNKTFAQIPDNTNTLTEI